MEKIISWFKENKLLGFGIGAAIVLLFFPGLMRRRTRRRRSRTIYAPVTRRRRARVRIRRNKPAVRRRSYSRGGKKKKAWQIKGSLAARRHMARIRKMR